jgi:uncharacterized protein
MSEHKAPPTLDVRRAAEAAVTLQGSCELSHFERLLDHAPGAAAQRLVRWQARFEMQDDRQGQAHVWLRLDFALRLPMTCQRCLGEFDQLVQADRQFRFVASEEAAEAQDDASEEDLLVVARAFDLAQLLEDEILMALPLLPRHDVCPSQPVLSVQDRDFLDQVDQPNPFAALAGLKKPKPH